MAEWNKGKVLPSAINGGQEFTKKDNLAINELNAIVNNSFYASEKSERAEGLAESAVKGNGTIVTVGGQIQGEWSADFAESERQKSKNLFKIANEKGYSITRNGVTATINNDYTITLNGTNTSSNVYWSLFNSISTGVGQVDKGLILDNSKTYTFVLKHISGSYSGTGTDNQIFGAVFRKTDGNTIIDGIDIGLSIRSNNNNVLNITRSGIDSLNNGYFRTTSGITYNNYTIGLMICEGSDTEFQSWNGAIVNEKQLNEAVETRELVYDVNNYVSIASSTLTTLKQYFDLFNIDKNSTYQANIGKLDESNFKTLVGTPTGFQNYVACNIKLVRNGISSNRGTVYELFAVDLYGSKIALGYIFQDSRDTVQFTGWTIIGG